jgi:hypothetical protein
MIKNFIIAALIGLSSYQWWLYEKNIKTIVALTKYNQLYLRVFKDMETQLKLRVMIDKKTGKFAGTEMIK